MKQVEAGAGPQADNACKQELQQVAAPCLETSMSKGKQCLQERLTSKCSEQLKIAEQQWQEAFRSCQEIQQKIQSLCGTDWQKDQQCYQKHHADVKAACRDKFEGRQ